MQGIKPPVAPKRPKVLRHHGTPRSDPWFWLREREDAAVLDYLRAENAYCEAVMHSTEALQRRIYSELRARIKEDDASVPQKEGEFFYYRRYERGSEYAFHCRKRHSLDAPEEVLLDLQSLAAGRPYLQLGVNENSPDHRYLAYSLDLDGSESYTIAVKDLTSGELLPERIPRTYYSLVWTADSRSFYYTLLDAHHRPLRVYRHRLGDDPTQDLLIYEERDPRLFVSLLRSDSGRFVYLCCRGINMSEWLYLDRQDPVARPLPTEPRRPEHEYELTDHGEYFLIRTNVDGAKDFKVVRTPIIAPSSVHWRDFIPHRSGTLVTDLLAFRNHLVVSEMVGGLPHIRILSPEGEERRAVRFDEEAYDAYVLPGREFDTASLRFAYSSLSTPERIYDYDMNTGERLLRKEEPVLGDFDPADYETRRLHANAADGASVPISLCYRKGTALDGTAPLLLYGYGAYGHSIPARFSRLRLPYLERGFVYAIAHIRGGMELGYRWYEDGKLLNKKNSFSDYLACAEHLVAQNFTRAGQILAVGGSAGGMLMGAVANMRPELFKAIIAHVPFVDVVNTMLDETLPLTTMEYNEWGDPRDKLFFDYMLSYSPYDNVKRQRYPHMLIVSGLNDPRVTYWEPAKWVAKLRDLKTDDKLLVLKTHMDSGHAGASGRFEYLKEVAVDVAFALKVFDLA